MAKPLAVGTESTCRSCGKAVAWLPPDVDWPYSKFWIHLDSKEKHCDPTAEWMASTRAQPTGYCEVMKADYSGPCHATVVDEELFMCGPHAKKERQFREKAETRTENQGIDNTLRNFLEPLCNHINDFYELEARMENFEFGEANRLGRRLTGYIVVNPAKLVELLKEIEDVF